MEKIPEEIYQKYKGQLKLNMTNLLGVFNCYGMGDFIPDVVEELVSLAEQFSMKIRGKDRPYTVKRIHRRPTE